MSGRLVILPKKTYCPWSPKNVERVVRDECEHAESLERDRKVKEQEKSIERLQALKENAKKRRQQEQQEQQEQETKEAFDETGSATITSSKIKRFNLFEKEEEFLKNIATAQNSKNAVKNSTPLMFLNPKDSAIGQAKNDIAKEERLKNRMDPMKDFVVSYSSPTRTLHNHNFQPVSHEHDILQSKQDDDDNNNDDVKSNVRNGVIHRHKNERVEQVRKRKRCRKEYSSDVEKDEESPNDDTVESSSTSSSSSSSRRRRRKRKSSKSKRKSIRRRSRSKRKSDNKYDKKRRSANKEQKSGHHHHRHQDKGKVKTSEVSENSLEELRKRRAEREERERGRQESLLQELSMRRSHHHGTSSKYLNQYNPRLSRK